MVCLSQHHHPALFVNQVCCTKCTAVQSTKFHNCTFWQQRCIEKKTNFLRPLWTTQQAGASSGSNSGFVVRLSQWRHSEKFQMSASCLGWYNVTLWPIVHFVNTLQTPPFDIHWSQFSRPQGQTWAEWFTRRSIIGQESPSVIHLESGCGDWAGWAGKWE